MTTGIDWDFGNIMLADGQSDIPQVGFVENQYESGEYNRRLLFTDNRDIRQGTIQFNDVVEAKRFQLWYKTIIKHGTRKFDYYDCQTGQNRVAQWVGDPPSMDSGPAAVILRYNLTLLLDPYDETQDYLYVKLYLRDAEDNDVTSGTTVTLNGNSRFYNTDEKILLSKKDNDTYTVNADDHNMSQVFSNTEKTIGFEGEGDGSSYGVNGVPVLKITILTLGNANRISENETDNRVAEDLIENMINESDTPVELVVRDATSHYVFYQAFHILGDIIHVQAGVGTNEVGSIDQSSGDFVKADEQILDIGQIKSVTY